MFSHGLTRLIGILMAVTGSQAALGRPLIATHTLVAVSGESFAP